MILIITHKEDYTADFVINRLNGQKIKYYRFNTEDLLLNNSVNVFLNDLKIDVNICNLQKVNSVWFRRIKLPHFENLSPSVNRYISDELRIYFNNIWELLEVKWLSIPKFIYQAENKFHQLNVARKIGLSIPPTLISHQPDKIQKFFYENNEDIIIKPIFNNEFKVENESRQIFTNKLDIEKLLKISEYVPLPSIFQKYIEKEIEIRITVVNTDVFSAYVDSQSSNDTSIDWRRKRKKFFRFNLPDTIKQKCINLLKKLNLSFGAIDMIKGKDGKYVFLEINPNGQWGWIEMDTGLPISDAIIKYLNI